MTHVDDEPNYYTTLGPVSENCRAYDELNGKNSKLTENKHDNNEIGKRGLHRIGNFYFRNYHRIFHLDNGLSRNPLRCNLHFDGHLLNNWLLSC
jgi:hypothetical protein